VIRDLGDTLTPDEAKKLHRRLAYLYRIHSDNKDWKAVGTIRGLCTQIELLEALVRSQGLRLPPKRRVRRKSHPGQLQLRIQEGTKCDS
jgi:hypothetical protein